MCSGFGSVGLVADVSSEGVGTESESYAFDLW